MKILKVAQNVNIGAVCGTLGATQDHWKSYHSIERIIVIIRLLL